ncbi:phosphoesterase, PA-phosphatase related [Filimonas lacunae]|nr:phosphoesterase, PA-phosphatase related [Filimonas lacunae]
MQQFNTSLFKKALIITTLLGIIVLYSSFSVGKIDLFLLLNTNLGKVIDFIMVVGTYLGDGAMWVPALLLVLYWKRKDSLPLLISSFALSTIFTQVCKYLIIPDAPRPLKALGSSPLLSQVHTVPYVEVHTISSFPSGHTTTAFTLYLVFSLLLTGNWWLFAGLVYALWVAYSRIYLSQHFPLDAGAGMIVATVSVLLSWGIQQWFMNRKKRVAASQ